MFFYVPSAAKYMVPPNIFTCPFRSYTLFLAVHNHKLLWASKFATAKIECSFEMGK